MALAQLVTSGLRMVRQGILSKKAFNQSVSAILGSHDFWVKFSS
jgi:hypothetical protein